MTRFIGNNASAIGLKPNEAGKEVRLLDYACGSGFASWVCPIDQTMVIPHSMDSSNFETQKQPLLPYVTKIRGIDVSSSVVSMYNQAAIERGLSNDQAHAFVGDLSSANSEPNPALEGEDMQGFDVCIVSMALHHMEKPEILVKNLVSRLRKGGILIALEGTGHTESAVAKMEANGVNVKDSLTKGDVTPETVKEWFREAGCKGEGEGYVFILNEEISHVPEHACKVPGGLDRHLFISASVKA